MSGIQCAECGRFLGEADFAAGHVYYEPESEFGRERIEWSCRRHGIPTRAAQVDTLPKGRNAEERFGSRRPGREAMRPDDTAQLTPRMMIMVDQVEKYTNHFYIDCEFDGHGGSLLSFGIVNDAGFGGHFRTTEVATDPWVIENVVPLLEKHDADVQGTMPTASIGGALRYFIGTCKHPVIVADSPVDIGRFCAAISTGDDGGWASTDYESMTFKVHNVDCYPTELKDAVQHNAYWDAMALREKLGLTAYNPNERLITTLFDAIQHGDEAHRAWLKEAIDKHFAGEAVPAPKGKGNSERLREALEACRDKFREYEGLHTLKLRDYKGKEPLNYTAELQFKINRNREMAELCDAALAPPSDLSE